MSILQAIVLGLVQGATEFAPVSSSGHLILVPWIFGWILIGDSDVQKSFDVALHVGTLIGALIYFRRDVARYAAAWFRSIATRQSCGSAAAAPASVASSMVCVWGRKDRRWTGE